MPAEREGKKNESDERCMGVGEEKCTSRWAALRALNALWTSRARFGGRLSLRLRPRLEDMGMMDAMVVVMADMFGEW